MAKGSHRQGPRRGRTRRAQSSGKGYLPDYFGPGARRRGTAPEPYTGLGPAEPPTGKRRPRPVIPDWARGRGDPLPGRSRRRTHDDRRFLLGNILAALGALALFVVVLAALLAGVWLVARALLSAPSVDEHAPQDFPVVWTFHPPELDPADPAPARLRSVDVAERAGMGAAALIATEQTWVVLAEHGEHRAVLGLDPRTGAVRWQREVPGVQCSQRPGPGDTVVCLAPDPAADQSVAHVLQASTGEVVDSWPVPVTGVWSLYATDTSLVVLSQSDPGALDRLTVLDLAGGAEVGALDLQDDAATQPLLSAHRIDGTEHAVVLFPEWGHLGANATLTSGRHTIIVDTAGGTVAPLDCQAVLITGGHVACGGPQATTMYDGDGEPVWTSPQVALARPGSAGAQVPVNVADSRIWHTDWGSGEVLDRGARTQAYPVATGTPEHPFLVEQRRVRALDGAEVRWQVRVAGLGGTSTVLVTQGVAIVDGLSALGLDLHTGEQLWHRSRPGDLLVVDDQLVNTTGMAIEVLDVS